MLVNLAHFNAPAGEHLASLAHVAHDQVQALDRSRLHFREHRQTGPDDDRTSRPRWCKLDDPDTIAGLNINVQVKSEFVNIEGLSPVNIRDRYRHKLKF